MFYLDFVKQKDIKWTKAGIHYETLLEIVHLLAKC